MHTDKRTKPTESQRKPETGTLPGIPTVPESERQIGYAALAGIEAFLTANKPLEATYKTPPDTGRNGDD